MKKIIIAFVVLFTSSIYAGNRDDFPSCYPILKNYSSDVVSKRSLFVIVDQTIPLPDELKESVGVKVNRFLKPGDKVSVINFSAYVGGNYTDMVLSGSLDEELSEEVRNDLNKKSLRTFDSCMKKQMTYVRYQINETLNAAFLESRSDTPKTELVGSLYEISNSLISQDGAEDKVVLLVSDMMENSSIDSFYKRGAVTKINPERSLEKFGKNALFSNLNGAHIYVIGAGSIPNNTNYRSQEVMRSIKAFWEGWAQKSGGSISGWGQPALLGEIN